jgi:excisionase family DNA binding protein
MKGFVKTKEAMKILGVHNQTLYRWADLGKIDIVRTPGNDRLFNVEKFLKDNNLVNKTENKRKICYCRVSNLGQKEELEKQVQFMKNKYPNYEIIKDICSGINYRRKGLVKIIDLAIKGEIDELVIISKDKLCRIGYELIELMIEKYSNGKIIVLNTDNKDGNEEVVNELVQIINVFSSKINGLRKYTKLIKENNNYV